MIESKDIVALFAFMRASYGHLWPHQSEQDMEVWLRKLGGFSNAEIFRAADRMTKEHPKHPPTLRQFEVAILGPAKPANTYLPPPKMTSTMAVANRAMTAVLMASGGVSKLTLRAMIELKNALVADFEGKNDDKFPRKLADQLTELMKGYENV
jgi:hypothetical protein